MLVILILIICICTCSGQQLFQQRDPLLFVAVDTSALVTVVAGYATLCSVCVCHHERD